MSGGAGGGKAQADREFRLAVIVAVVVLLIGQVLLVTGLRWVALFGIALPGTIVALLLVRRWQRMAADDH
jgi:type III secretory pathway component EscR